MSAYQQGEREAGLAALTHADRAFLEAVKQGLTGDAGRMQQLLRRSLRRPPSFLVGTALHEALAMAAAQATPPTPGGPRLVGERDLLSGWEGPTPLPGRRFPRPDGAVERPGAASSRNIATAPAPAGHTPADRLEDVADLPAALTLDAADAAEPVLPSPSAEAVRELVLEHGSRLLAQHGITPTRTVLLTGPPGTGKTMTARWIAAALARPLLVLDLAAVMSHELGRTAQNLVDCLESAARTNAVLFIDEFDAIASARGDRNDVGEVRRLVNVLLTRLDRWPVGHLLLAATNHPELLDRAVDRRFEKVIYLAPPDTAGRREILRTALTNVPDDHVAVLAELTDGWTGSGLVTLASGAQRRAALRGRAPALLDLLSGLGGAASAPPREVRDRVIHSLASSGLSARKIAGLIGVSHPTVSKVLSGAVTAGAPAKQRRAAAGGTRREAIISQ